jgi:hypothetical protein
MNNIYIKLITLLSLELLTSSIVSLLLIVKTVKNKKHVVTNMKYISVVAGLGMSPSAILV